MEDKEIKLVDKRIKIYYFCKGKGYTKKDNKKETCSICERQSKLEGKTFKSNKLYYPSSKPFEKNLESL